MPNNNQFRAIPSSSSRTLDITSSNSQIQNGDSNNKYPNRDCTSSNSTSTDNSAEPIDYQYEDGALPEETEETNGDESYSNLDLNTVKLFVGQIPYSYSEDNLYPLFSQFGPVAEIVVIRDRFTFKSRGCAFVSFRNKQDADACIRELNQRLKLPPLNTPLRVKYAYTEQQLDNFNDNFVNNAPNLTTSSSPNDSNSEKSQDLTIASNFLSCLNIDKYEIGQPHPENKLFIRNIPKSVTEEELSTLFESFGEILDVVVLRTTIHTSKGCGFIKFTNSESADMVINTFKREIISPIQEYQQGAQQEGTTIGGPSNQRLVELTEKLLESSFLMKGAITPLLVRYADNDFAQSQDQENVTHPISTSYDSNNGYHSRRRKSYPFSHHHNNNRRGSFHHQQAQHYYQNPYYDHSNGYPHHHGGMYQPNYYGYPGQGQDGVSSTDTVYFYHLYNNPYGATGTTTTTITAPSETIIGNNGGYSTNGSEIKASTATANATENGPSPVPPMYYYYPPYYYHPQYANSASTGSSNGGGINNNGNAYHHQQYYHSTNKHNNSSHHNNTYVKNNKYKSSSTDRKNVTKCTSDA